MEKCGVCGHYISATRIKCRNCAERKRRAKPLVSRDIIEELVKTDKELAI